MCNGIKGKKLLFDNIYAQYIVDHLSARDLLEQLSEESNELGQATNKFIRAYGLGGCRNYTPVTKEQATISVVEEAQDVIIVLYLLGIIQNDDAPIHIRKNEKIKRWAIRLGMKDI